MLTSMKALLRLWILKISNGFSKKSAEFLGPMPTAVFSSVGASETGMEAWILSHLGMKNKT